MVSSASPAGHQQHKFLFDHIVKTLRRFESGPDNLDLVLRHGFRNWALGIDYYEQQFQAVEPSRIAADGRGRQRDAYNAAVRAAQAKALWYVLLAAINDVGTTREAESRKALFSREVARVGIMSMPVMDAARRHFEMLGVEQDLVELRRRKLGRLCQYSAEFLVVLNSRLSKPGCASTTSTNIQLGLTALKVLCLAARFAPPELQTALDRGILGELGKHGTVIGDSAYFRRMLRLLPALSGSPDSPYCASVAQAGGNGRALEEERVAGLLYGAGAGRLADPRNAAYLLSYKMPDLDPRRNSLKRLRRYAFDTLRTCRPSSDDALVTRSGAWLLCAFQSDDLRLSKDERDLISRLIDSRTSLTPARAVLEQLWRRATSEDR